VVTETNFSVQVGSNVPSLRHLKGGSLAENHAACSASNFVLVNPGTHTRCTHTQTEARNVVVKDDAVLKTIGLQGLYHCRSQFHLGSPWSHTGSRVGGYTVTFTVQIQQKQAIINQLTVSCGLPGGYLHLRQTASATGALSPPRPISKD